MPQVRCTSYTTLAITEHGQVFTWGDGDGEALGHRNGPTDLPQQVCWLKSQDVSRASTHKICPKSDHEKQRFRLNEGQEKAMSKSADREWAPQINFRGGNLRWWAPPNGPTPIGAIPWLTFYNLIREDLARHVQQACNKSTLLSISVAFWRTIAPHDASPLPQRTPISTIAGVNSIMMLSGTT